MEFDHRRFRLKSARDAHSATGERDLLGRSSRHPAGVRSLRRPLFCGKHFGRMPKRASKMLALPFRSVIARPA
jgi:hypothetical protein